MTRQSNAPGSATHIRVTLIRGLVNRTPKQRDNVRSLGLRKIGQSVVLDNTPAYRGMIQQVAHMVTVEETD